MLNCGLSSLRSRKSVQEEEVIFYLQQKEIKMVAYNPVNTCLLDYSVATYSVDKHGT
jgi:hypothetical protein